MLSKKINEALNNQILEEAFSSQLYLAMASWCETNGLTGAAKFLYLQTEEERMHMLKIFHHINERGGIAIVPEIPKPQDKYKTIVDVFNSVLSHEKHITKKIHDLVDLSTKEKDHATVNFLQWFVNEQIEEEATAQLIIDKIKLIGSQQPAALFLIDKEIENIANIKATQQNQSVSNM